MSGSEKEMESERYQFHEHPLTLCEIEGVDRLDCPVCDMTYCFDGYNCSNCKFHPEKCSVCDCKPSGSFYFCRECWPKSPFIHKPCAEFPQKIQIALRPNCSLKFVKDNVDESSSSDMYSFLSTKEFDCHFCEKSQKGDKLSCDMCNFQICCSCARMLIKYHQGGEHIQHFIHDHPLVLLEISEAEDTKDCELCLKEIHGQSYCCAPCKFYIHKSCSGLLQEVKHPFHPHHYLTLQNEMITLITCNACGIGIDYGFYYRCDDCNFVMHLECLSRKPNIKYQGHEHDLLTLVEDMSCKSQCHVCGLDIENTFYLRCFQCSLDFHVQCGPAAASLPPIVVHKNHNHPLSLVTESAALVKDNSILLYCNDCREEINPNHPCYGCFECDQYNAHVRCVITEIRLDEKERHEHFTHRHLLLLLESERNDDIKCHACQKLIIQGHTVFGCSPCGYYLHKSCFELPKVMHHKSHESHYLTLKDSSSSRKGACKDCGNHLNGLIYRCGRCDFDLDLDCASQQPSIKSKAKSDDEYKYHDEDREEGIGHYSHYHHLTPSEVDDLKCEICHRNIRGISYGCEPCMFYIHKSCAQLPQKFQNAFHSRHCLTLRQNIFEDRYSCDACFFYLNPGVSYRCDNCNFDLHLECVSLKPNIKYEDHQHLLILVENMSHLSECEACHCEIDGTFFVRCVECDLNFHVQCGTESYPSTVEHRHHHHPLKLTTDETLIKDDSILHSCGVCKEKGDPIHPSYCCVDCKYYTHMRCVVTEIQFKKREKIGHFSHDHFLFLVGNKRNDDIKCYACDELIQAAQSAYGCDQCRYYLHKSCIELPRQIQHLFHRHPLTLKSHLNQGTKYHRCGACNKKLVGFFFQCYDCFVLDVDCALLQLGVQFEGDENIFTDLFEMLRHTPECRRYLSVTTGAWDQNCVKCNFIVYLLRSSLPQTIECSSHHHPLTLTEKVADDNYGTQICDVCEEDRDPEVCVYYCAQCDFIAEFVCMISEVMLALQKQPRDVLLRSTNTKNTGKSLTYRNLLDSFTVEEKQKWKEIKQAFEEEKLKIRKNYYEVGHEAKASAYEEFGYSDEESIHPFLVLQRFFGPKHKVSLIKKEECNGEILDVGDYKTIPRLAGVLKDLIDKYGDVGASCTLPQSCSNLKIRIMMNFCATVRSMCDILIQDVDNRLLNTWWMYFSMARRVGFKVEFLFDHLERIEQAHKCFNDTENQLHQMKSIHRRYDEMAEISREIDKQKTKLDSLWWQTQQGISNISFQRLRLDAEQLSKAREFGMKKAGMHTKLL